MEAKKPKNITLRNVPADVHNKLVQMKMDIMQRTKRSVVSYEEIIFNLVRKADK